MLLEGSLKTIIAKSGLNQSSSQQRCRSSGQFELDIALVRAIRLPEFPCLVTADFKLS